MTGVGTLCWMNLSLTPWRAAWLEACTVHRGPLWAPLGKQMLACLGECAELCVLNAGVSLGKVIDKILVV